MATVAMKIKVVPSIMILLNHTELLLTLRSTYISVHFAVLSLERLGLGLGLGLGTK